MTTRDISFWLRGSFLEALLVVLATVLLTRGLRAAIAQVIARHAALPELPERLRYRRAFMDAGTRMAVGVLWFVAALLVVIRLRLPIASLVAPATVVGAALGFGAQRLVADFLSGFFLLTERQLAFGDTVEIAPPGTDKWMRGTVEEVTLRYTRLRTPSGVLTLSNADVRQVLNRSKGLGRA